MQKVNPILQDARTRPLAYVVQVVGLIVVVFNLYLATKLSPIAKTAEVNAQNIEVIQENYIPRRELESQFKSMEARLDRIENKLDRIIER